MRILLVTPAPPRSRKGNRVTALRWARILRQLGHRVSLEQRFRGQPCDVCVAIHARRSAESVVRFHEQQAGKPLVVCLSGTDLYHDIAVSPSAQRSLELATRLVVLQPDGIHWLPQSVRQKARTIFQSVPPPRTKPAPLKTVFEATVIGHLRPVKDPFRAAMAARKLPASSKIRIVQIGAALTADMERRARAELQRNPRYRWLGEVPHWKAKRHLARSRLLVLSSKMEGGANVISEALAARVPVLSSRISGSIGLLGDDYPGYFETGDTQQLAELLRRAEAAPEFYERLMGHCRKRAHLVDPRRERHAWKELLTEVSDEA